MAPSQITRPPATTDREAASMAVRLLGPLEIARHGRPVPLGAPKQRAVLIALLLRAGDTVPTGRLIDDLWAGDPPRGAKATVQAHVSRLRTALDDRDGRLLRTRPGGYQLVVEPEAIDAVRAERLHTDGRAALAAGDPAGAQQRFEAALALWAGEPLADIAHVPFARVEIARLDQLRGRLEEARVDALLAQGRHDEATAALPALIAAHPLRERPRGQLMLARHHAGEPALALEGFRAFRELLVDEAGIEPGPELQRLATAILRQDPALQAPGAGTDPPPATTATARPAGRRRLVGRAAELAALRAALAGTRDGRGSVVLVAGDPGIGKSRLLEALAADAGRAGARVVWGRCHQGDGAPALWPWVQAIRELLAGAGPGELATLVGGDAGELARLVPEIGTRLGMAPAGADGELARARFALFEAVAAMIARAAETAPLVLALDDVHWAQAPSLQLLCHVAEQVADHPVVVAATYRDLPAERSAALDGALARLARHAHTRHLPLGGLTADDVAPLLADTLGPQAAGQLARAVHERTAGNPFFVTELARLLETRRADPQAASTLPVGVRHVLRHRIAALPERTRSLLAAAAVAGRSFDLAVVAAAVGVEVDAAFDDVQPALAHRLVEEAGDAVTSLRFVHALVHEAVLAELASLPAARLHAAVGAALAAGAGAAERTEEIAAHFWHAADVGEADRALTYALAAAETTARKLAYEHAEGHLRRALALATRPGVALATELDVRRRLVELLVRARGHSAPGLIEVVGGAPAPAPGVEPHPLLVHLWFSEWSFHHVGGELQRAAELADALVARAEAHPDDPVLAAAGHFCAGASRLHLGDRATALAHLGRAQAVADAHGERLDVTVGHLAVDIPGYHALARALDGDEDAARRLSAQSAAFAERLGRPFSHVLACFLGGLADAVRHDAPAALGRTTDGLRLCEAHHFAQMTAMTTVVHAWASARTGRLPGQAARIEAALDALSAAGAHGAGPLWLALLADVWRLDGDPAAARAALDRGHAARDARGERGFDAWLAWVAAALA